MITAWTWTPTRLKHLATVMANLANVALVSIVVPFLLQAHNPERGLPGMLLAIGLILGSFIVLKEDV